MNIQKYIGPDGQPTHYAFSANVMAHDTKQWAPRLEAAITASRVRLVADIEVIAGRVVAGHTMVKIYVLFDQQMHTRDNALIHLTSFCNVLGVHGFSACSSSVELNFINTDIQMINS
jgi:hypothetical protein